MMRMPTAGRALRVALLLAALAVPARSAPVISNPDRPLRGEITLSLKPLWRLGAGAEDPLVGRIQQVLVDEAGHSYLLDAQLERILVVDRAGRPVARLGRGGEGPGEFRRPRDLLRLPDGRLGVVQDAPPRVAVLDREGNADSDLPLPTGAGAFRLGKVRAAGPLLALQTGRTRLEDGVFLHRERLELRRPDGTPVRVLAERESELGRVGGPLRLDGAAPARLWTTDAAGRLYLVTGRQGYRIRVLGPDGATLRVIERDYEPLPLSPEEIARRRAALDGAARLGLPPVEVETPRTHPDILGLWVRPGGELWVRSSRGEDPGGGAGSFDVFDAAGRFVHVVHLDLDFDDDEDGYRLAGRRFFRLAGLDGVLRAQVAGWGIELPGGAGTADPAPAPPEVVAYELPTVLGPGVEPGLAPRRERE